MVTARRIYKPDELQPSEPIHPGEMLKDELIARGISQRKFAGVIGMPYAAFNSIINGKRPMTIDTALKIEAETGIPANIWRGLQSDYDMQTARRDNWTTYAKRLQFYNAIFVSGNIILIIFVALTR